MLLMRSNLSKLITLTKGILVKVSTWHSIIISSFGINRHFLIKDTHLDADIHSRVYNFVMGMYFETILLPIFSYR